MSALPFARTDTRLAARGLGVHMLMLAAWARAKKVIAVEAMASKRDACSKAGADEFVDAHRWPNRV